MQQLSLSRLESYFFFPMGGREDVCGKKNKKVVWHVACEAHLMLGEEGSSFLSQIRRHATTTATAATTRTRAYNNNYYGGNSNVNNSN